MRIDNITRTMHFEYWDLIDLPIGEIPYRSIQRMLKDEIYQRKFNPTNYRDDLLCGWHSAVIYWFPRYVDVLFDYAIDGKDFFLFFKPFPPEIKETFIYLFPELIKKLEKVKESTISLNHFEETKFKKRHINNIGNTM